MIPPDDDTPPLPVRPRPRRPGPLLLLLALATAACAREETRPAGDAPAEVNGYRPDTLPWFREGRPVRYAERAWRPVGRPIHEPATSFQQIGDHEGMTLWAPRGDAPPFERLFFPYGNDTWQALEPAPRTDSAALVP